MAVRDTTLIAHRPRLGSVHSVDRVVLTAPDLDAAENFFNVFGLRCVRISPNRLDVGTYDSGHIWMTYLKGQSKKLQYVTFAMFAADFDEFSQHARQARAALCKPHPLSEELRGSEGCWLRAPDGLFVQVIVAEKSSPDRKSEPNPIRQVPLGVGAAPSRSRAGAVRPRHLSHVLFFSDNVLAALDFYVGVLGLRLSDKSGYDIAFLHGAYGSDHHLVAFVRSTGPGLHHTSWDVGGIDEVGLGAEQMRTAGHDQGWGLGRHVLGSNYFHYVRDPWGSYAEYSFAIDYVPANFDWPSGDHPGEDSFYVWGPKPPCDFAMNYEVNEGIVAPDVDGGKLS